MHPLYRADPARAATSQLSDFARFVRVRTGLPLVDYPALHAFSVTELGLFWTLFLEWSALTTSGSSDPARKGTDIADIRFFPNVRLSWAESLLAERGMDEQHVVLVSVDETGARSEIRRAELRQRVRSIASGLEAMGLREGDRVAGVVRNTIETVVACLAVTSLGATWSSLSLDMGMCTALARLQVLEPKVLLVHSRARQNGALIDLPVRDLVRGVPSLSAVVRLDDDGQRDMSSATIQDMTLHDLEVAGRSRQTDGGSAFRHLAFDHPLLVLFSSGTTGAPKGIVHGHGGTLLEHVKEHRLHCDLRPGDTLCFQTSTGWMMWNWTISALASGARVVLYDGSVSYPERDSFLQVAAREGVTVLGVSPAYLQYLVDAGMTGMQDGLRAVRMVLSTGSVLRGPLHRWAKERLVSAPLESISGGTDIVGCFVMGNPWSDTYEGECSSVGLGFDVRAWNDQGPSREGTGELVCMQPFPSRPVAFLRDPDAARLRHAYYEQHPGAWTHGDLVELTPRGTVRVLGRCDGVLNIRGIRIGPSEIYEVLARQVPQVSQALAVDAEAPDEPGGKRLVLFVVLHAGSVLDRALTLRIKKELRMGASAAHVPSAVVAVEELPATFSNKISEAAMQDALNGRPVRNLMALRNPRAVDACADAFRRDHAAATSSARAGGPGDQPEPR